jgi:hypothetical protein
MKQPSSFGIIPTTVGNTLINIYSEENMILNNGDECFFLLTSLYDYHLPVICKGKVIFFEYAEGMTRRYYIEFHEIVDDTSLAELSLFDKIFNIYLLRNNIPSTKELHRYVLHKEMFQRNYFDVSPNFKRLFQINSFFVRGFFIRGIATDPEPTPEAALINISTFRKEYVEYIISDLQTNIDNATLFL